MKSFPHKFYLLGLLLAGMVAKPSDAAVTPIGDVLPADRLDTDLFNEGLPPGGNFYDSSLPPDAQTRWEKREDIIVGQKAFGRLDIDGNSQLRYQDLIIGDIGMVGNQMRAGTGTVLITGIDALYNNDPNILHPGLPMNFASVNPRDAEEGFDIYVGRAGQGTLDIRGGGRAEIQDAVIVGDQPGSLGKIFVTGFATYLGSGGFDSGGGLINEPHQMIIGRRGIGFMTISDGGTVVSESVQGSSGSDDDPIAASIGADPFEDEPPELGGQGTVTVTGPTSQWTVGGTLQVGGFHDITGGTPGESVAGENVVYQSSTGRGTLNVSEGAIVVVRAAIDADVEDDPLRLVIGRFGRVELNNGFISVGSGNLEGGGGDGEARAGGIQLLNDGVIRGGGRIDTGVFRNRFFGEVRVDAGQKLLIDSSTDFTAGAMNVEPLANWGLMQIIGTPEARAELEIERAPDILLDPIQPFRNSFVEESPIERSVGQITAAHATLRFRSGLSNQGKLAFIAGDNFVSGPVTNEAGNPDPDAPEPAGEIAIAGNNTTVTFEDHFVNNGNFEMFPNSSLVLFENDFTQGAAGAMAITLGGRPTGNELSFLSIMGDANLDGTLEVDLFSTGANPIDPMPGDEFEILNALGDLTGIFTNLIMPNLGAGMAMFPVYDYNADTVTLHVASLMGVMGADFNGDGIVNGQDLAIWQQNVGLRMGATGAQGDADGDGDVDGDDFLEWQRQLGPVPGAGSGSGLGASVPEPSSLAILLAGSLALAIGHRKSR
jgi:hypothetical protein